MPYKNIHHMIKDEHYINFCLKLSKSDISAQVDDMKTDTWSKKMAKVQEQRRGGLCVCVVALRPSPPL